MLDRVLLVDVNRQGVESYWNLNGIRVSLLLHGCLLLLFHRPGSLADLRRTINQRCDTSTRASAGDLDRRSWMILHVNLCPALPEKDHCVRTLNCDSLSFPGRLC